MAVAALLYIAYESNNVKVENASDTASISRTNTATAANPHFSKTTVWADNEGGKKSFTVPGTIVTKAGTVLVFTEARANALDFKEHEIWLKRSTDGGMTWSDNLVVQSNPGNGRSYGNPTPVQDAKSGAIYVFYRDNAAHVKGNEDESGTVKMKKSTDDGLTWSNDTDLASLFAGDPYGCTVFHPGPGHGLQLENGRLLMSVWASQPLIKPGYTAYVTTLYSDDGGSTWKRGGNIRGRTPNKDGSSLYNLNENRMVQLENGDIYITMRVGTGDRYKSYSSDNGNTWSLPVKDSALSPVAMVDQSIVRFTKKQDGIKNRIIYSRPNSETRDHLTAYVSYDEGATWTYSKVVDADYSYYSDLSVTADNHILVLYEDGYRNKARGSSLSAAKFNIEWLTDGADSLHAVSRSKK